MTPRNAQLLDLYSDYLIASLQGEGRASKKATLLAHAAADEAARSRGKAAFDEKWAGSACGETRRNREGRVEGDRGGFGTGRGEG